MRVLVVNSGSTSVKVTILETKTDRVIFSMEMEGMIASDPMTHKRALRTIFEKIDPSSIEAVGHRVVHGGSKFRAPQALDRIIIQEIEELSALAPIHNPANLAGIKMARAIFSAVPHVAVFDTAFHSTIPDAHALYAIPRRFEKKYGIRKYGFHGISHEWVLHETARELRKNPKNLNVISVHLGGGVSVCAIKNGKSIDTTMGFTPLDGLMMGTRSGAIDPSILIFLQRNTPLSLSNLEYILEFESGLKAIGGTESMQKLLEKRSKKDPAATLAVDMFVDQVKKQIGAYIALLGTAAAVSFTGGIGFGSALLRTRIMRGVPIAKNTRVLAIKANEAQLIAHRVAEVVKK